VRVDFGWQVGESKSPVTPYQELAIGFLPTPQIHPLLCSSII